MKQIWNTYKSSVILLGSMVLGGVIGFFWGPGAEILQPVADTFLHLLYCCVVPLIFCSLTAAIAKMTDLSKPVSYTHLRAHETRSNLVCRLLLEKNFF